MSYAATRPGHGAGYALRAAGAIARMSLIEALRGRLLAMLICGVLVLVALAGFLGDWALVERREVVVSMIAPIARAMAVVVILVMTVSSVVREFSDRSIQLLLAAPISRSAWLAGRLAGLAAVAGICTLVLGAPVAVFAASPGVLTWSLSMWLELTLLAAFGLLAASVLRQVPASLLASLAFYLMSRIIGVLILVAERAPFDAHAAWIETNRIAFKAIGLVLPRFDLFTRTDWLLQAVPATVLLPVLAQTAIYLVLLGTVARIDFARAEL